MKLSENELVDWLVAETQYARARVRESTDRDGPNSYRAGYYRSRRDTLMEVLTQLDELERLPLPVAFTDYERHSQGERDER